MEEFLQFYDNNWHKLLYDPESKEYEDFCNTVTYDRAKHYYAGDACGKDSFESHCYDGMEHRGDFKKFWTMNASNLDRLKDFQRNPSMVNSDIFKFLQQKIGQYNTVPLEAADITVNNTTVQLNQHDRFIEAHAIHDTYGVISLETWKYMEKSVVIRRHVYADKIKTVRCYSHTDGPVFIINEFIR
jgi:hypothetical protein